MELKSANTEYSLQLEQLTQQLDVLTSRKQQLEDEMAVSAVKREAAQLYEQLAEAESKRDKLAEEARQRGTPAQVSPPSYPFHQIEKRSSPRISGRTKCRLWQDSDFPSPFG